MSAFIHYTRCDTISRKSTPPKGFCAIGPNQVWTWDITWLPASIRGMFFYLYMIVDVFSRKIVGWEVFDRESSSNASSFVYKAVLAEGCILKPLVLNSDNGSPQKGFTLNAKLELLGIMPSFSRPRVSNDNPTRKRFFERANIVRTIPNPDLKRSRSLATG